MAGIPAGYQGETGVSADTDWSGQTIHITCVASTGGGYHVAVLQHAAKLNEDQ
jgi:hypothetical protein